MPRLLSDFVRTYDDTLSYADCAALIARFEAAPELHERKEAARSYAFTEINVSRHWPEVEARVLEVMMTAIRDYWQRLEVGNTWPAKVWAEKIRLKRYMPGGADHFPRHVDVMNSDDSRRFLTAILYLNEPGGGETIFHGLDMHVTPIPGRMVVFPPLWLFPHEGRPPLERPKYILHRYLWYPPPGESPSNAGAAS
jgi:prolyl 4-hydroxylase